MINYVKYKYIYRINDGTKCTILTFAKFIVVFLCTIVTALNDFQKLLYRIRSSRNELQKHQ